MRLIDVKHKILIKILLFFLLFSIGNVFGQSYSELRKKWLKSKSDTASINAGLKLVVSYSINTDDSFMVENRILHQLFKKSKEIKYNYGIIESGFRLGHNYIIQSNLPKAIEYYYLSLKQSEIAKDKLGMAQAKMGIGIVFYMQNNWNKAIDFFKGSLEINKSINKYSYVATQQYLIGLSMLELKKLSVAKFYLDSAIQIKRDLKDSVGINECILGYANIFKETKIYDSALYYYSKILPKLLVKKEYVPVSLIYSSMAEVYCEKNALALALSYAKQALSFSEINMSIRSKMLSFKVLNKIYYNLGDYKLAYFYIVEHNKLKDSLQSSDFSSQISLTQANYIFDKEQAILKASQYKKDVNHKIELRNKNRNLLIFMIISLVALLLIIIVFVAYRFTSKQKKVSEALLLNILPLETVKELKKIGKSLPKNHHEVTIMFCDVKNFSHIAESLSPSAVVEMLDTYFQHFDTITEKYEIEKIKTIGDAYMCVGGLNGDSENAACMTIQAAKEFIEFTKFIEQKMLEKYKQAFHFRVGVHTGNVVSGVVGLKKYSYDIWGDAVNVAARMEQNSVPGKINISGKTYSYVKEKFPNLTYRGRIPIKNKGEIDMYFFED